MDKVMKMLICAITLLALGVSAAEAAPKDCDVRKCKFWGNDASGKIVQFSGSQMYSSNVGWGPCKAALINSGAGNSGNKKRC